MAVKLYDLARVSTATTGTGTITLGAAVAPFLTFAAAGVQNGDTVRYGIWDAVGGGSEVGYGVYATSGPTLTRNPTTSSNSNSAISLSGQAQVFITVSAEDIPGFANPSSSIGLTANNGLATTAMRSDATPPLSQAISPTWTGNHTFSNSVNAVAFALNDAQFTGINYWNQASFPGNTVQMATCGMSGFLNFNGNLTDATTAFLPAEHTAADGMMISVIQNDGAFTSSFGLTVAGGTNTTINSAGAQTGNLTFNPYAGCKTFVYDSGGTYYQVSAYPVQAVDMNLSTLGVGTLGVMSSGGGVIAGGYVTPQMYGCAGNGTTDDTTNLSTCLNSGYPVLLIGKFKITSQITVTLNDSSGPFGLNIIGGGQMLSQILLTTQTAGITVDASYSGNGNTNTQVVLKDFALVAEYAGVGSSTVGALNVIGAPEIGSIASNYRIENVTVTTNNVGTNYAYIGIFLKDVRNGWVRDCNIVGLAYNTASTSGIVFTSSDNGSTGNAPCDVNFDDCHITSFNYGIELRASGDTNHSYSNDWQGVHIDACTILSCSYCIYANSTDSNANGLTISNCITSFYVNSVYINNVQGFNIANNYWENVGGNSITFVAATIGTAAALCLGTYTGNTHYNAAYTGGIAISASASGSGVMKCVATGNVSYGSGATSLTYTVTDGSNNY